MNLTPEEKKQWILDNCVDEYGNIDLSNLDFSDFEGNVFIGGMIVKKDLIQFCQQVKGDLIQSCQQVKGDLYQGCQIVEGNIVQDNLEKGVNY